MSSWVTFIFDLWETFPKKSTMDTLPAFTWQQNQNQLNHVPVPHCRTSRIWKLTRLTTLQRFEQCENRKRLDQFKMTTTSDKLLFSTLYVEIRVANFPPTFPLEGLFPELKCALKLWPINQFCNCPQVEILLCFFSFDDIPWIESKSCFTIALKCLFIWEYS